MCNQFRTSIGCSKDVTSYVEYVDQVLELLQIGHVQNSIVGSVVKRGISGGQRKRVNGERGPFTAVNGQVKHPDQGNINVGYVNDLLFGTIDETDPDIADTGQQHKDLVVCWGSSKQNDGGGGLKWQRQNRGAEFDSSWHRIYRNDHDANSFSSYCVAVAMVDMDNDGDNDLVSVHVRFNYLATKSSDKDATFAVLFKHAVLCFYSSTIYNN